LIAAQQKKTKKEKLYGGVNLHLALLRERILYPY